MLLSRQICTFGALLAVAAASSCSEPADGSNFTVALVRAPPPNWPLPITNYDYTGIKMNISQCVDAGIELISQAKEQGSDLVSFPELWFPGFPKANGAPTFTPDVLRDYVDNSIVVGDAQWARLVAATRRAGLYVNINFSEREGDFIYMAQSLLSPSGDVLIHRRKLRPSGSERDLFSDGTTDGLQVVTTPFGRWGMLECGEHFYPSMTFNMHVQNEHVHLAPFPYLAGRGDNTSLWWENEWINTGAVGTYSVLGGTYAFTAAVGAAFVTDPMGSRVAHVEADADFDEFPVLYYSFDASGFNVSQTHDIDSQTSWGTLRQIVDSFPEYVPKVQGDFVQTKNVSVTALMAGTKAVTA
ncbi:hypothetical protein ACHAQA_000864 [Verticillium albo-atrum]